MNRLNLTPCAASGARMMLFGDGRVEGYASLFGEVDQSRDMVMPGAFAQTLRPARFAQNPDAVPARSRRAGRGLA